MIFVLVFWSTLIVASLGLCEVAASQAAQPDKVSTSTRAWSVLHVGMLLYTGDDGGGATTLSVCATLESYFKVVEGTVPASCKHVARGQAAYVTRIISSSSDDPDSGTKAPHILLRAASDAWSGYTSIVGEQPAVPIGTVLLIEGGSDSDSRLSPTQGSDINVGDVLEKNTRVRVLRHDPATGDRSLKVLVISGKDVGHEGWIFANGTLTLDGETAYLVDWTLDR